MILSESNKYSQYTSVDWNENGDEIGNENGNGSDDADSWGRQRRGSRKRKRGDY